jgi:hypothetical protein
MRASAIPFAAIGLPGGKSCAIAGKKYHRSNIPFAATPFSAERDHVSHLGIVPGELLRDQLASRPVMQSLSGLSQNPPRHQQVCGYTAAALLMRTSILPSSFSEMAANACSTCASSLCSQRIGMAFAPPLLDFRARISQGDFISPGDDHRVFWLPKSTRNPAPETTGGSGNDNCFSHATYLLARPCDGRSDMARSWAR